MDTEYELNLEDFITMAYPATVEKALPELKYETEDGDIESLLIYSLYFCALNHCLELGMNIEEIKSALNKSVDKLDSSLERSVEIAKILIDKVFKRKIIREDQNFDDMLSEAIWDVFYKIDYMYPSFISEIIAYGLDYDQILRRCKIKI